MEVIISCVLFLSSQLKPGNQSPTVPSLPRRPGSKNHRPTRLLMPNPPEQSWIYWAQLPWRTSTTFPTMQWTVWRSGGLVGNTHRKQRKREKEEKRKKSNILCSEVPFFSFLLAPFSPNHPTWHCKIVHLKNMFAKIISMFSLYLEFLNLQLFHNIIKSLAVQL